jgi:uncharacterized protein YkwD
MRTRILRLLAVLLVAGAVAGGAYGAARHFGGEAGCASDLMTVAPAAPALSVAPIVPVVEAVPTPTAQPPPTVEPTPEPVEEAAAAPQDGDVEPPAVAPHVFAAASQPEPPPPQPPPSVDPATLEAALVAGINAQRVAAGLPPLQLDPALATVAGERSSDMAQGGYFSHVSPTGETFSSLMQSQGVSCSWCGEDIAYNNYPDDQTVGVVLSAWMASPRHRDNILNPNFSRLGVGVALAGSGLKYYSAVFAGP